MKRFKAVYWANGRTHEIEIQEKDQFAAKAVLASVMKAEDEQATIESFWEVSGMVQQSLEEHLNDGVVTISKTVTTTMSDKSVSTSGCVSYPPSFGSENAFNILQKLIHH